MLVDMHTHERTFSKDSELSIDEIVCIARERGLDAVCITDHDSLDFRGCAEKLSERFRFPIFVGVETFTLQGDIAAFGVQSCPNTRIEAQDFIDQVNDAGGFCFACHPYRNNQRGLGDAMAAMHGLHGVEVLNGSTSHEANERAREMCLKLGLKQIGASDAHDVKSYGRYATWLPRDARDIADFVRLLREETARSAVWNGHEYEIII